MQTRPLQHLSNCAAASLPWQCSSSLKWIFLLVTKIYAWFGYIFLVGISFRLNFMDIFWFHSIISFFFLHLIPHVVISIHSPLMYDFVQNIFFWGVWNIVYPLFNEPQKNNKELYDTVWWHSFKWILRYAVVLHFYRFLLMYKRKYKK